MHKLLILIFILFPATLFSQEHNSTDTKNAFILEIADVVVAGNCAINYEHRVYLKNNIQSFLNIGFGGWYSFKNQGQYNLNYVASAYSIPITINTIKGFGNHYFEWDIGARYLIDKRWNVFQDNGVVQPLPKFDNSIIKPVLNLGYRYRKVNGLFIFRAFIGLGGIGIGIGKAF